MRVLVITGDMHFRAGHPRYDLQRTAVEELSVVYWGRGSLWPQIPKRRFDVVTVQDPFWRGLFAWYAARKLGCRFNVQVHTDLSETGLVRHVLAQAVLKRADSVRVVSEKIKSQIKHPRVTVLPVYIDVGRFKAITRRPEQNLILWVGRFEHEKDPLLALEILKSLPDAKLIMLGKGSLEPHLRVAVPRLNLGTRVELAGWQDPLPYLAKAAVVLSTSRHESYGVSIVEALAAGVPVVAPDVGIARSAGAIVVPRQELAGAVRGVLQSHATGTLALQLSDKTEWQHLWQQSLL